MFNTVFLLGPNEREWFVIYRQEWLVDQRKHIDHLNQIFEEEAKVVEAMEKIAECQQEDDMILSKYAHQDNLMIKVRISFRYCSNIDDILDILFIFQFVDVSNWKWN